MNKLKAVIAPITDWLKKPKFWFVFALLALAIGSVVFSFFPCYKELAACLIAIVGGFGAVAVLFPIMRRVDAAEKALDQTNKPKTRIDRIIGCLMNPMFSLGFALLGLAIAIGSAVLALCSGYEGLSARLIAMAGGFLAVAVLLQTMKRADAAENANIQKTFSDAVNHLGHECEGVIIGGIYSLLDLAKENEDYRLKVFRILCAYIKTTTATGEYQEKHEKQPSTTIQTLMNLLFIDGEYLIVTVDPVKTNRTADEEYNSTRVDLVYKVCRADLRGAYLAGSILRRARLQDINLAEAQLQNAILVEAQLQGALLAESGLQGAALMLAQLQGANLSRAQLQGAKLEQTEMQGACMYQTKLPHKTQMGGSDLRGVSSANLDPFIGFKRRIKKRFCRKADLAGVVFDEVNPDLATAQNQGTAITGSFTEEEADQWIKEYDGAFRWKNHQD